MFVNCPSCRGLVATDPATDEPPERCPRCASRLRGIASAPAPADDARSGVAAAIAEHVGALDAAVADPAEDRSAQPALSIATLLQAEPALEPAGDDLALPDTSAMDAPAPAPETGSTAEPGPEATSTLDTDPAPVPVPDAGVHGPQAAVTDTGADASGAAGPPPPRPPRPARGERRATPSFVRRTTGTAERGRRWPMAAAIAALSLLLGVQWLLADRARLAADAAWRPVVEGACRLLRCTLPAWREPTAFTLLDVDVRPHPSAPDALRVTASFRNDAAWPQAWPELVLTLSDIDGRPLGIRAFTASEYLGGEPPTALLSSGQGAMVRMDVREPGPRAVGYAFDFR